MAIDKTTVEKIIEEKVKPYILEHGGDIAVTKIEDGIVYITLYGSINNRIRRCREAQRRTRRRRQGRCFASGDESRYHRVCEGYAKTESQ